MKLYFTKYLPKKGEIKVGDILWQPGEGYTPATKDGVLYKAYTGDKKVKLFLCSRDVQVGDKVFPFIRGHMDDVIVSPFHPKVYWDTRDFISGYPDEPHTVLDLNHTKNECNDAYKIRTDMGYGSIGRYIKIIGESSPDATWVKEGDEFSEKDVIIDVYRGQIDDEPLWTFNGDKKESINICIKDKNFIVIARLKGPCGHFH